MLEYAPVPRIVRRGIYKNKIVWLQGFRAMPEKNLDIVRNFALSCYLTRIGLFAYVAVLVVVVRYCTFTPLVGAIE